MGNAKTFAGTRIKVSTVASYIEDGVPEEQIYEAFPQLSQQDLAIARELVA